MHSFRALSQGLICLLPAALFAACASSDSADDPVASRDHGAQSADDAGANGAEKPEDVKTPSPESDAGAPESAEGDAGRGNGRPESSASSTASANPTTSASSSASAGQGGTGTPASSGSAQGGKPGQNDAGGDAHFFLPTVEPDNTAAPRVVLDAAGGIHSVYPAYAGGGAYYSYCAAGCQNQDDVKVVYLPTEGTVANAMLTLTTDSQPRILLSTFADVIYATCDSDCTKDAGWKSSVILSHNNEKEVTGKALALDKAGKPHFMIHTYRALFGIGQLPAKTEYASCTVADCSKAGAWSYTPVATQIWEDTNLLFDAQGTAHLGFVAEVMENNVVTARIGSYGACSTGTCSNADDWVATGLANAYSSMTEVVGINPSVSLALTHEGKPRLLVFAVSNQGEKNLDYFECDKDCTKDGSFRGTILSTFSGLDVGIDLALDAKDRPRFVHTLDYNIALAYCDTLPCAEADSPWALTMVEPGANIPKDNIFPYPNCNIGAWFLHSPSLALTADGRPVVGYQARDVSGGLGYPDGTNKPACAAGTDMTWSRMTLMSNYKK